jgi:DNA polymerase-3 subunit alpha
MRPEQVNGQWRIANGVAHHSPTPVRHSPSKPRIFLGLGNIKGLEADTVRLILDERRRHGPFADLHELLRRVPLAMEQARILVRVGALRFTGRSKPQLLWDLALLHRPACAGTDGDLFVARVAEPRLPELETHPRADAYDELDLLGFPLCDPFTLVECGEWSVANGEWGERGGPPVANGHSPSASSPPRILKRDMEKYIGRTVHMLGCMIHVKTTTTSGGDHMSFGCFIDPAGDFWDSTQFPAVAAQYPFRGRGVYRLTGVVEEEFGHCALRTISMEKLPWKPDPRYGGK